MRSMSLLFYDKESTIIYESPAIENVLGYSVKENGVIANYPPTGYCNCFHRLNFAAAFLRINESKIKSLD